MMVKNQDNMNKKMTFAKFKHMAIDDSLTQIEKIGFPDSYREDYEALILRDISDKLLLDMCDINFLDVGCGCSELTNLVIQNSLAKNQQLYLLDSAEMLDNLVDEQKKIHKVSGRFPMECQDFIQMQQS